MTARGIGRPVHPNSLAAFQTVDLGRRQGEVLDAIAELCRRGERPCDADVGDYLHWTINQITPRRGELAAARRIVHAGDKIGKMGRKVACWRPAPVQLDFFGGTGS